MFVDAKVCSLDKLVQLAHETGLTRFKDWSDRLQTRSNHFFLQKNTKSAMVVQNRNAAEITVWGKNFLQKNTKLAIEVWHFIFSYILMMGYAIKMPKRFMIHGYKAGGCFYIHSLNFDSRRHCKEQLLFIVIGSCASMVI